VSAKDYLRDALGPVQKAGVHSNDLDNPMFEVSIPVLRNMWLAKYSNGWVAEKNMEDAKDWYILFERLKPHLEVVFLQDKNYNVYRISPE
jgi:hypothetical protein